MPETAAAAAYAWWTTPVWAGITYGTIITTVVAVYGTIDAQSKARARARSAREAYNAGLTDRTVSVMQADNPWQVIYGEAVVAPAIVATLTSGDRDQYKHVVAVWAAHDCQAIEDVRFNGETVGALDTSGNVTTGRYFSTATETEFENHTISAGGVITLSRVPARVLSVSHNFGSGSGDGENVQSLGPDAFDVVGAVVTLKPEHLAVWAGLVASVNYDWVRAVPRLRVRHHLGADDQEADAALLVECPTEWSSTDRGRGLCYSVFTFDLNEPEFQGGPPQITGLLKGKRVYDPRADSTQPGGSGAQRVDTPSTWGWSQNPALCVADFVRGRYGKAARANQVQWPTVVTAANVCDELWDYETPDQPRYTCNGSFRTSDDPDSTLDQLCQGMAGFATYMGTWHVQAGSYTAPVMALADADNAGPVEVVPAPAGDQVMNGLRGRFYNPDAYDQVTDYAPYVNAAFVTEDGESYMGDLDLPFTRSHARCHQLARTQVERSRGMQLVYPAKLRAFSLKPGQRITLSCSVLGISNSIFRVVKREYAAGQAVKLTLQQDDPSYYDATDAPASLPVPTQTTSSPWQVAPPANLQALSTAAVVLRDDDGTVISRVRLTYTAAADVLVRNAGALQVEYRLADETAWQRHADGAGDSTYLQLLGLQDQRAYVVRGRWRNSLGVVSDWASTAVKTALPSEVVGGSGGVSFATVSVFQNASSTPAAPTGGSFNFDTGVATAPAGWLVNKPASSSTQSTYEARYVYSSTTGTGTVAGGLHTTPVAVARNGADGAPGEPGDPGTPGAPALSARLSTYAVIFAADSMGTVDSGQSFPVSMTLFLGATDDTSNWALSRSTSDGSITTTLSGATVTITGMGTALDTGWVDIEATRSGYPTQGPLRVNLAKAKRATPASGPVANIGSLYCSDTAIANDNAYAAVEFMTNGTIRRVQSGGATATIGNWYLPNSSGVGAGYQVIFTAIGGSPVDVNSGVISVGRYVGLTDETNGFSIKQATVGYSLRTAAGAVVADGLIYLDTNIEV